MKRCLAPAGIVLAAGEGARMGAAKILLAIRGTPLIALHIDALHSAGCGMVCVVTLPPLVERVRRALSPRQRARTLVYPAQTAAPAESLYAAWGALQRPEQRALLITPVDMLPPRPDTLRLLLDAVDGEATAVTPALAGCSGHPVALAGAWLHRCYINMAHDAVPPSLRAIVRAADRKHIDVRDPAVLGSLNDPGEFLEQVGHLPKFID
jgi:CTP:molybdopterin cytidylyltransferase MocA